MARSPSKSDATADAKADAKAPETQRRRNAQLATENTLVAVGRAASTEPATPSPRREPGQTARRATTPEGARADAPTVPAPTGSLKPIRFERIPEAVLDRYYSIGEKWFLDTGDLAFVNHGDRLTTRSENTQIIRDMIAIARENQAQTLQVAGTENFLRVAWREALRAGLKVEGFAPTEHDEKQYVRQLAREAKEARGGSRIEEGPASEREEAAQAARRMTGELRREKHEEPEGLQHRRSRASRERANVPNVQYGELLEHGAETYKRDPRNDMSYYVKLGTPTGVVELWGKDLERALSNSKSQPKSGDEIGIRRTGQEAVTVTARQYDEKGAVIAEQDKAAHRNEWRIEKKEFFEERAKIAQTVRDTQVSARAAVEKHPQLVGTAFILKEAEEVAKGIKHGPTREAFLALARDKLATEIESGDPLRTTRIRHERTRDRRERTPTNGHERAVS